MCVYLTYQSLEDWTTGRDILRCNPSFHGESRYDCAIVNIESPHLICARLLGLFRCTLPSGLQHDVALVHMFDPTTWKPSTKWRGCQVHEESHQHSFVLLKYLVRGAHMIPVFDAPKANKEKFYFNDLVDYDMFLRAGN